MKRLRVLMSAYACEPGLGSEAGIGWNCVHAVARNADVWVITRRSNEAAVRAAARDDGPHFVFYDLPAWLRFWKRGARGARLYYVLWQIGVYLLARRLHMQERFDVAHHVTFGALWMPSFLFLLPCGFVWGPVGGGETPPAAFLATMSARGRAYERARNLLHRITLYNPIIRVLARRSDLAFATTRQSATQLRALGARDVRVLSHVALPEDERRAFPSSGPRSATRFRVCTAGRLVDWKAVHLGIEAFARLVRRFPAAEYVILGEGPARGHLERLALRLGISQSVTFMGSVSRAATIRELQSAHVLLHPSLHDSGGYACAEAMAAGCPVICFDVGGPPLVVGPTGGVIIRATEPATAVGALAEALLQLAGDPAACRDLGIAARTRAETALSWELKGDCIHEAYGDVLERRVRSRIPQYQPA